MLVIGNQSSEQLSALPNGTDDSMQPDDTHSWHLTSNSREPPSYADTIQQMHLQEQVLYNGELRETPNNSNDIVTDPSLSVKPPPSYEEAAL